MRQMKHSLLRRLTAAALSAVLLATLSACSEIPTGTTVPTEPAAAETTTPAQTEPIVTEPLITEPTATEPAATEPLVTEPPETTAPQIDYENLVTDAACYVYPNASGGVHCYHIPKVNLESCAAVNDAMYRKLSGIIDLDVQQAIADFGEPNIWRMIYVYGHRNGVVSILVDAIDMFTDYSSYYVYYISPETGTQIKEADMLRAFRLSKQNFSEKVHSVLVSYWDELLTSNEYYSNEEMTQLYDQLRAQTLSYENVQDAIPFIRTGGKLSFAVTVYVPAGGGSFQAMFDYETGQMLDNFTCNDNHSNNSIVAASDALQYFIENCDRRYFSAAEVAGFSKEDYLYARNAVYAKSGWIFSNQNLANYFKTYSWYTPSVASDKFTEDMLNAYQIANRDLIVAIENESKGEPLDALQNFIENCDRRYFSAAEVSGFSKEDFVRARNAVYAKSGRIFNNQDLADYFKQYSWYSPSVPADKFSEDMLNAYQIANRDLIVAIENESKGESLDALQNFIENCDRRYFSAAEVSGFSKEDFVRARNAVYAKSGRIFNDQDLADYFKKYSWYSPSVPADKFSEDMLNAYQIANRDLIVALEDNTGIISAEQAYAIACEYWDYEEGDIDEESGFELYIVDDGTTVENGITYYCFRLRWLVDDGSGNSWLSTVDYLNINAKTGACSYSIPS